jgi:effector-binding domain-containing protein/DNA-binding transcriptional MerR regulator
MFKIGDFSKLTFVSVRMLRHYDEIGLLTPRTIDPETGYRYYAAEQMVRMNRIYVLREMGFSLQEIKDLLSTDLEGEQLLALLRQRHRSIADTLDQERQKQLRVETLMRLIEKEGHSMKYEVAIKAIPEYRVLSLRDVIPAYQEEGILWQEMMLYTRQNGIRYQDPCYSIYHDAGYREKDVDVEVTLGISDPVPETDRIKVRQLEALPEAAVVMHQGPYDTLTEAYQALGIWMESNHYELNGSTRAIFHKGPYNEKDPANYLTEIQAPVSKKG